MATFAACPASYYFVKLSILFFYLRVFELQAKLRYIIYALFAYCTIYYGIAFFAIVSLCNIRNRAWDITVTMNCFAYGPLTFVIGGMDLVADAIVLAFPVPMVLRLRISWAQRIYLLVVFLFGITATAACAIRVGMAVHSRNTHDATMTQYKVVTLFCIEHYLALIAACMPTLGPFFRYLHPLRVKRAVVKRAGVNGKGGHRKIHDDHAALEGWRRPGTLDHSLIHGSVLQSTNRDDAAAGHSLDVILTGGGENRQDVESVGGGERGVQGAGGGRGVEWGEVMLRGIKELGSCRISAPAPFVCKNYVQVGREKSKKSTASQHLHLPRLPPNPFPPTYQPKIPPSPALHPSTPATLHPLISQTPLI
ncbi:MAG: hypothetical protein LQ344_005460 [Seirophora lacunosa]|nr:MAG: hypothetical protein LQ344_005460 [Seirophora lacunosa]